MKIKQLNKQYFLVLLLGNCLPIIGQTTFTLSSEQDILVVPSSLNEDRNYTMGLSIEFSNLLFNSVWHHYPQRVVQKSLFKDSKLFISSIGLMATGFTPENLAETNPVIGDRPYAFLIGINTSSTFHKVDKNNRFQLNTIRTVYGLMGTDIGRRVQTAIHEWDFITRPIPLGWGNQIGDGGSFTGLIDISTIKSLRKCINPFEISPNNCKIRWDGVLEYGASLGFYNRAYVGTGGRIGFIDLGDAFGFYNAFGSLASANKKKGFRLFVQKE